MQTKYIHYLNSIVHYKTTGKGMPVVLLHGFAEDSSIWDIQIEFLQESFSLIIPDIPGSGQSEIINQINTGMELYADIIRQILKKEQVEQCVMIGHSMGGYITLAFAEKFPDLLIAFGLFHSSAYADDTAKIETRKKAIEFIKVKGAEPFLKTSIPGLFFDQGNSKQADALIEKGKAFSGDALIQYYEAMIARPDRTAVLKNTTAPVLFILGEHDKAVPFEQGLEQSHIPGQSYIHVLHNSAHMGMLEEAEKSNEILANFLQSLELIK